jgi:hypothetical protein
MSIMRTMPRDCRKKPQKFFEEAGFLFKGIRLLSIFLITFPVMVSCEDFFISEAVHVNIPGSESRLVVYSYISPQDTVIRVRVHRSDPYYSKAKAEPVSGKAIVSMARKGGKKSVLEYSENYQCYVIRSEKFKIEPGFIYQLSVELENGEKVEAECYVPELKYEYIWTEVMPAEVDEWGTEHISINWKITTRKNPEVNYYSTGAYIITHTVIDFGDELLRFYDTHDLGLEKGSKYIADGEGRTFSYKAEMLKFYSDYYPPDNPGYTNETVDSLFVYVMQTDENYYLFHRSYENYYYSENFPFEESILIYSNIDEGLGVFAGYNRQNVYVPVSSRSGHGPEAAAGCRHQASRH